MPARAQGYVLRVQRAGKPLRWYIYAWRGKGAPLVDVVEAPTKPTLTATQMRAIADALEARRTPDVTTVGGAMTEYRRSPEWRDLAPTTRKLWDAQLDRIEGKWGTIPMHVLSDPRMKPRFVQWRDSMAATPRAADVALQVLRMFLDWAELRGLALANPARSIPAIYRRTDHAPVIWLAEDIAAIREHAAQPLRDALALAELTGLRRADLVALRWDEVGDLAIRRTAAKRSKGKRYRVTMPRLPALDALLDDLRTRPRKPGVETVLVNLFGQSFTGDGLNTSFADARKKANGGAGIWHTERDPHTGEPQRIQKRLHDFRGTFATHLMTHPTARLTNQEIADLMGWSVEQVAEIRKRYVDDSAIVVSLTKRLQG